MAEKRFSIGDEGVGKEDYSNFVEELRRNMDPSSRTILIVDDEKGIRKKVARDMRCFLPGAVICEAANGREALAELAEIRTKYYSDPLLIVLDLNMPVMDGWELIDALRKDYEEKGRSSGIPVIVLSSTSGEKGRLFGKKSVHGGKGGYSPLVSIAKETCVDRSRYDGAGEKGLLAWVEHFVKKA
ncbi:MAG: response regulator [Kiritimatiellia bacterium]